MRKVVQPAPDSDSVENGATGAAFEGEGDVEDGKGAEVVRITRHQPASAGFNMRDRPEPVPLNLEEPIGVGEGFGAADERHGVDCIDGH